MPIIAQQLIRINANDDLSIHILKEINSCGCIKASAVSLEQNIPLEQLKITLQHIAKQKKLKCDPEFEICCADKTAFEDFVSNLKDLKMNNWTC